MANRLSDDELRKSLQAYGEDVGPITPTTRAAWEKRLTTLKKINGPVSSVRALNAFSSDDSEIENSVSSRVRKKRTTNRLEPTVRLERLSLNRRYEIDSSPETDVFKKPSPVHTHIPNQDRTLSEKSSLQQMHISKARGKKSLGKHATFDVETSDSDFDAETPFVSSKPRYRKKTTSANTASDFASVNFQKFKRDNADYESSVQRKSLNSNFDSKAEHSVHPFSPILDRLKRDHTDLEYRTNGYLSTAVSNGDFHEEKIQGSSTNYSHCISWLLVIGAILFFTIIGALYMTEVQKTSQSANKNNVRFCSNMDEEKCKLLIQVSRELYQLLTVTAGQYECDSSDLVKTRNLTVREASEVLQKKFSTQESYKKEDFHNIFNQSLYMIMTNPDWGIKWYSLTDGSEFTKSENIALFKSEIYLNSSALEATQAAKSFWCRLRHSVHWTASRLLVLCFVVFVLSLLYLSLSFWKKRREAQEKLFYEMVEKVIDILQEPVDSYQSDFDLGPYKPVVNIRDTLISPKERKEKMWLWDKVVAFIEENESRVSVEYKKITGEDFKVWRWHANSLENEGGKHGKVWQGQAFNNLGKGKNATYSPTPCLKIRNMFDSEEEYGNDWQVSIQDAILEKCEGNDGIRHIAVDAASNEGCVYMLCNSTEAAGKAYNALHGWWFDGKLVTVKYLRYERYIERFPDAVTCTEPLKPSNNKRLSVSTPYFSSALERS